MNYEMNGLSIIGSSRGRPSSNTFRAFDPLTGENIEPDFHSVGIDELNHAALLADAARIPFGRTAGAARAVLLQRMADNIEGLGERLIERASLETGLSA